MNPYKTLGKFKVKILLANQLFREFSYCLITKLKLRVNANFKELVFLFIIMLYRYIHVLFSSLTLQCDMLNKLLL